MPWIDYGDERVSAIVNRFTGRIRKRFLEVLRKLTIAAPIATLERMIRENRIDDAILLVEAAAMSIASEITAAYIASGTDVGNFIDSLVEIAFDFDGTNPRAQAWMRNNRFRFIAEFTEKQRQSTRAALIRGISTGTNPRVIARDLRAGLGLTHKQTLAVNNFRAMLESGSRRALTRELRDHRFDGTIRRAIVTKRPLTENQIEMMVSRYRERLVNQRAELIARNEALNAVHAGNEEAFQQAIDSGDLSISQLIREWNTAKDERVRGSHKSMHGQTRLFGETFTSGLGNELRYPGDELAPAKDVIECRCALGTRVRVAAAVADALA
jgi:hypothetical protein